jgi:hypothetical protein
MRAVNGGIAGRCTRRARMCGGLGFQGLGAMRLRAELAKGEHAGQKASKGGVSTAGPWRLASARQAWCEAVRGTDRSRGAHPCPPSPTAQPSTVGSGDAPEIPCRRCAML